MSEYINREELLADLQEDIECGTPMFTEEQTKWIVYGLRCAVKDVKYRPAADVAEVTKCKDCKFAYINGDRIYCRNTATPWYNDYFEIAVKPNNYCSYGASAAETNGHWIMSSDRQDTIICSKCNVGFDTWKHEQKDFHFCPNCGEKMDDLQRQGAHT